jgi:hypothetical protein
MSPLMARSYSYWLLGPKGETPIGYVYRGRRPTCPKGDSENGYYIRTVTMNVGSR